MITNLRTSALISEHTLLADSFFLRLRGLLGRTNFHPGEALVLPSCNLVHTFFMRFPIDLLFCSSANEVLRTQSRLKPWRVSAYVPSAAYVVELPEGTIEASDILAGDILGFG